MISEISYTIFNSQHNPDAKDLNSLEDSIRSKAMMLYSMAADFKQIMVRELYKPQVATFNEYANRVGWDEEMVDILIKIGKVIELLKANNIPCHVLPLGIDECEPYLNLNENQQVKLARTVLNEMEHGVLTIDLLLKCKQQLYPDVNGG